MHFLGTCEKRAAAQWRLPKKKHDWLGSAKPKKEKRKKVFRLLEKSEFGIAQRFFFPSTQKVHQPRSQPPLHFKIGTYSKFAWEDQFLAPGVCFPQPCRVAHFPTCALQQTPFQNFHFWQIPLEVQENHENSSKRLGFPQIRFSNNPTRKGQERSKIRAESDVFPMGLVFGVNLNV